MFNLYEVGTLFIPSPQGRIVQVETDEISAEAGQKFPYKYFVPD